MQSRTSQLPALTWLIVWWDSDKSPDHAWRLLQGRGSALPLVSLGVGGQQLSHQDPLQAAIIHPLPKPPSTGKPKNIKEINMWINPDSIPWQRLSTAVASSPNPASTVIRKTSFIQEQITKSWLCLLPAKVKQLFSSNFVLSVAVDDPSHAFCLSPIYSIWFEEKRVKGEILLHPTKVKKYTEYPT